MRIAVLAFSTVLLSGCSWLGIGSNSADSWAQYNKGAQQSSGRYHAGAGQHQQRMAQNPYGQQARGAIRQQRGGPCEIRSVAQPAPQGCSPEQVTIALPGGGSNNMGYGGGYNTAPTQTTGQYGTHTQNTQNALRAAQLAGHQNWTRPRFRVNGSFGMEHSINGEAFQPEDLTALYNPLTHINGSTQGTPAAGQTTTHAFTPFDINYPGGVATPDLSGITASMPGVSNSDIHPIPMTLSVGAEYAVADNVSIFTNASHTASQGGGAGGVTYSGRVYDHVSVQDYDAAGVAVGGPTRNSTYIPDVIFARTAMQANDMKRSGLELGGRYYFKDAFQQYFERPVTPYISAAAGGAHYNALEVSQTSEKLLLSSFFAGNQANPTYESNGTLTAVEVLEKGWVPTGAVTVGAEWQVTPKAALAFETGLRYEGGRKVTTGGETDGNLAIPLTLRGSIGF
ncbi:MAG: hypothetical protein V3U82_05965 [Robiginitomaculum sp.]